MTDAQQRFNDVLVKWVTVAVALGGFVIAINNYNTQQDAGRRLIKKDAEQRVEEYKRRLWERQLDLYLQACKAASTLATSRDATTEEYLSARSRFDQLYHGELCVVESPEVEARMVQFRAALKSVDGGSLQKRYEALYSPSLNLAHACRESTESQWDVRLGKLSYKPSDK